MEKDPNATVRHPCNMGSMVWDLGFEGLDGKVSEKSGTGRVEGMLLRI